MPFIKATMIFKWSQGQGWTESHLINGTSTDVSSYITPLRALAQARAKILGTQGAITFIRIGVVVPGTAGFRSNGNVQVYTALQNSTGSNEIAGTGGPGDFPDTCALIRIRNADGTRRTLLYLRGMPDGFTIDGGLFDPKKPDGTPDPGGVSNMNDYITALTVNLAGAGPLGWAGRLVKTTQRLTQTAANPDGTIEITANGAIFPGPFDGSARIPVRITNTGRRNPLNGTNLFVPASAELASSAFPLGFLAYGTGGTVNYNTAQFIGYDSALLFRIVERKVGRQLFVSRGRRRVN